MKKLLLSLGSLGTIATAAVGLASCGPEKRIETLPYKEGIAFAINGKDFDMNKIFRDYAVKDEGQKAIIDQTIDDLAYQVFKNGILKNADGTEFKQGDKTSKDIFNEIEKEVDAKIEEEIKVRKKAYRWDWEGKMQMDLYDKHGGSKESYKKFLITNWASQGGSYDIKKMMIDSLWTSHLTKEQLKDEKDNSTLSGEHITSDGKDVNVLSDYQKFVWDQFKGVYGTKMQIVNPLLIKWKSDEYSTIKVDGYHGGASGTEKFTTIDGKWYKQSTGLSLQTDDAIKKLIDATDTTKLLASTSYEPFNKDNGDDTKSSSFEKLEKIITQIGTKTNIKDFNKDSELKDLTEDANIKSWLVYPNSSLFLRFRIAGLQTVSDACVDTSVQNLINSLEDEATSKNSCKFGNYVINRNQGGYHIMAKSTADLNSLLSRYINASNDEEKGFSIEINILDELKNWSERAILENQTTNTLLASYLWGTDGVNKVKDTFGIDYTPWFMKLTGDNLGIKTKLSATLLKTNFITDYKSKINELIHQEVLNFNKKQEDRKSANTELDKKNNTPDTFTNRKYEVIHTISNTEFSAIKL